MYDQVSGLQLPHRLVFNSDGEHARWFANNLNELVNLFSLQIDPAHLRDGHRDLSLRVDPLLALIFVGAGLKE